MGGGGWVLIHIRFCELVQSRAICLLGPPIRSLHTIKDHGKPHSSQTTGNS